MWSILLASIVVSTNCVSFSAKATGVGTDVPVEFLIAGPESDRDYETIFLADDSPAAIVKAFREAGIPAGKTYDLAACNLWPVGSVLTVEPSVAELIKLAPGAEGELYDAVYTGGNGNFDMPAAVFSTYTTAQSLITFDDAMDQSVAYGRFLARRQWQKGEKVVFKFAWKGARTTDFTPDFPADKTLGEAVKYAQAVQLTDKRTSKVNGFKDGQFFYQAFLPKEQWRDRRERLTQPVEIRLKDGQAVYTLIDEDWKVEGDDPKLTPREVPLAEAVKAKCDTCFIYAPATTKLAELYRLKRDFPPSFRNWYIYTE